MTQDGQPTFQTRDAIRDVWGPRTPFQGEGAWPERVDERVLERPDRWVQSACVLCSNGCALDIGVKDGRIVGVRGRGVDRVNRGRLGPKGLHGWIANNSPDRLVRPLVRRSGRLVEASWDEAMGLVVEKSRELLRRYGPLSMAFYNTGQMFLEEYWALAGVVRAGIGTPHLDGNTRLCTATAATALIESFGTDGDPGSYTDFDVTDAILLVGHNMASTQTVLWSRLLDRLDSPARPRLVVIDPRVTPTAERADVHLAPRLGTNVPVLNGLLNLLIEHDHVDHEFIAAHTVGFDTLRRTVAHWPPERVEAVADVPRDLLRAAARLLGEAPTLVSTVLQGVYQSHQATAAAMQVNNLNLLRGMIGRPGCSVFQMNGQPTAQNTRECGANGELAAFLNFDNPDHVARLAAHWNVAPAKIPSWVPPTHIMQIMRFMEEGSVRFLWILATNPAVSLPELARIRKILSKRTGFVVVSDAFMNETAELADVVLPAALWGEKTGCFTNADRTVHISHKAVEPPGEARSDHDALLDYARRMGFKDKDGAPLLKWRDPEGAFDDFKRLTKGRPCDYSGLSYAKLSEGSGVQWPCNEQHPDGAPRLYTDHIFNTSAETCETYGHDLITGASITAEQYRAQDPGGRAMLKAADHTPMPEEPDASYPFWLTTGRVTHHFHTRTKTGRSPELAAATPEAYVELSAEDATELGVTDGDWVEVASRRGTVEVIARIGRIKRKHVFLPFHFGTWDAPDRRRAANELTLSVWDPVSKQPCYKFAAVRLTKVSPPTMRQA